MEIKYRYSEVPLIYAKTCLHAEFHLKLMSLWGLVLPERRLIWWLKLWFHLKRKKRWLSDKWLADLSQNFSNQLVIALRVPLRNWHEENLLHWVIQCKLLRDGSVIYGNDDNGERRVRTFKDGKLKISGDGLLEHDEKGIPISGDVRNSWAGFSLLQALFVKEHNTVCDTLKVRFPFSSTNPMRRPSLSNNADPEFSIAMIWWNVLELLILLVPNSSSL